MGFWHTGYIDHHETDFFESRPDEAWTPPRPAPVPCPHCHRELPSPEALAHHLFDGHPHSRPLLLFQGRECGRARLTVTGATHATDWVAVDCQAVAINGRAVVPGELGQHLAPLRHTVVTVELRGEASVEAADIEFAIADAADLDAVEHRLRELVQGQQLTMASIQAFVTATDLYSTAARYRDGIAIYLYGVLAREESSDSGLERHQYRDRFSEAVELLQSFDRPAADAICGLVAFHFNQFSEAASRSRSPRVAWAAARLRELLDEYAPISSESGPPPDRSGLDFVLSDAHLERVLTWTCLPLDGEPSVLDEMEAGIEALEPLDQLKVRVLCAEHARRCGAFDRGLVHANELRHNSATAHWARAYVAQVKTREGNVEHR